MIKDIFTQNINREIETVIKADDTRKVDEEIYEYVITNEIADKITSLFSYYVESNTVNGAWISGFFGSGKSHLLKILSYVLSNKKMSDGNHAGEVFENKIEEEDALLKGYVHRAIQMPAESILFNIDQQANITSKADENAVLSVFYKMFYNHLGFYGGQSHIAEFEYWLFKKDKYDEFKTTFNDIFGKPWFESRIDYFDPDVTDAISSSLEKIMGNDAEKYDDILETIEENQTQSIDDFGEKVMEYLNTKGKNHRINFFVDEVGQYIANRTKLMVNLQTIVETLQTKTKNRVWVFVTSQSDIDKIVGDLKKSQKYDFSKIMDRLRARINLTSADIEEVVEKRLLAKTNKAIQDIDALFEKEEANLKTLITLSDVGQQLVEVGDKENFIKKYPFLNYQFTLFQNCRVNLAKHNAFEGEFASVGERSMISVFQLILKQIENEKMDVLIPFDQMFDGINNELRSEVLNSIITAEKNLSDKFAIRVLKALFMVKYYDEFVATRQNISVLLIDNLHLNLQDHQDKVKKALALLEQQNYLQRNGDVYEFLTDIEKDVEKEIKNTEIDESKVNEELKKLFFDNLFGTYKIRFNENKQEYNFFPVLDGVKLSIRDRNLGIEIYTPNYEGLDNINTLKIQSLGLNTIRFICDADSQFIDDLRISLKIQSYYNINQTKRNNEKVSRILHQKLQNNNERKRTLANRASELLGKSTVFLNGEEKMIGHKINGKDYAVEGFQLLVKYRYPHIKMIGDTIYTEDTFKRIISGVNIPELFSTDDVTVSEAETELLTYIERRKNQNDRTSLYDIAKHFNNNNYGWYNNAIFSLVAMLYVKGKIEAKQGENSLEKGELLQALLNTAQHATTYIAMETVYSPAQINLLKNVYNDLFNQATKYTDAKDIAIDFKEKLKELLEDVNRLVYQQNEFPFLKNLAPFQEVLKELASKNYKVYLEGIEEYEDRLLDEKENHYDPIKSFMNGQQKEVYRSIMQVVNGQTANFDYIDTEDFSIINNLRSAATPYKGDVLRKANEAKERITTDVLELIKAEREKAKAVYKKTIQNLEENEYIQKLDAGQKEKLFKGIKHRYQEIDNERFVAKLRNDINAVDDLETDILNRSIEFLTPQKEENEEGTPQVAKEPIAHYIRKNNVHIDFPKTELKNEQDVEEYIAAFKKKLLEEIKNNRRIKL